MLAYVQEYTIICIDLGNESLKYQKSLGTMYNDYSFLPGQTSPPQDSDVVRNGGHIHRLHLNLSV